jgi:hypothetical protein
MGGYKMKFHIKTVETVLIKYIIDADTVEEAKEVAMDGYSGRSKGGSYGRLRQAL